ncbi:MAG TPA: DUF1553 domain-containing protein [Planctomycetes bacterium]|nr:DUF1553 domain-containing protein [Planctomycetota bacterium]
MSMLRIVRLFLLMILTCGVVSAGEPVDYLTQVKPLLKTRCFACHSSLKQEGGLRLDSGSLMMTGGDSGPAVAAGDVSNSPLYERLTEADESLRMPMEGKPFSPDELAIIKNWIKAGAKTPADEIAESDPKHHWAFQLPEKSPLPKVATREWQQNPIDAFTGERLERQGLAANERAAPHVLLRRVYLDLTGLPPTREQLITFLERPTEEHYREIVEMLLDSPQYGERWGRHWMDVWRYSDWYGRRSVNDVRNSFPHIWRWRDWIINSLNADQGYDQMITELLAADEIAPEDDSKIVATGFIARNWYSLNYDVWMKDLVEHTGKAFLGIRMNCAHCHDHKYDPITQEEYFAFRAFFEPLEVRNDRVPGGPKLPKYIRYKPGSGASLKPGAPSLARIYDHTLDAKTYMYHLGDARERMVRPPIEPGTPSILGGQLEEIATIDLPSQAFYPGIKPFIQRVEVDACVKRVSAAKVALEKIEPELATTDLAVKVVEAELRAAKSALESLQARIAADDVRYRGVAGDAVSISKIASKKERMSSLAAAELTQVQADHAVHNLEQQVAEKQEDKKLAQQLAKAKTTLAAAEKKVTDSNKALQAESEEYSLLSPTYPDKSTGRRTSLAHWIANRNNPLTARVAINHIWARHFGRPIVDTVFDFGRGGKMPSHPKLLDWLAVDFMEHDWSMKHVHRLIVTSQVYRLSSHLLPEEHANNQIDRDNIYLWRYNSRRLEGEAIRDSVLFVSGMLDKTLGGPALDNRKEDSILRRSLYFTVHAEALGGMQFLQLFDAADPCDAYRRGESLVPQQALGMINSRLLVNSGRSLTGELLKELTRESGEGSNSKRQQFVTAAFETILCRRPTAAESQLCLLFLDRQVALFVSANPKELNPTATSGLVPAAADPNHRALESLVRTLFNHNDFVTIK